MEEQTLTPRIHSHKLPLLDGLRGVAALVVLWYHLGIPGFPHGYLSVDFFFMLSGFVVTLAYQQRLDAGYPLRQFLAIRVARLYPLYVAGLLLGAVLALQHPGGGMGYPPIAQSLSAIALGLAFLPRPFYAHLGPSSLFPFNVALWSLFFEVLANVGHGLWLRRRSDRTLAWLIAGSAIFLGEQARRFHGLNLGTLTVTAWGGLARVCFDYLVGMGLYRLWTRGFARMNVPGPLIAAILLAVLAAPLWGWPFDVLMVVCVFPPLLLAGAYASLRGGWLRLCTEAGGVSYALYVLHGPLMRMCYSLSVHLHLRILPLTLQIGSGVLLVLLAVLADRFYDAPARAWLKKVLVGAPARPAVGVPSA